MLLWHIPHLSVIQLKQTVCVTTTQSLRLRRCGVWMSPVKEVWLWLVFFSGGAVKRYLGLDAVEASEPEDLSAAQLSLSAVDLLLVLCQLLPFLPFGLQAQPRLLQARQPLRRHRGDHLEAGFVTLMSFDRRC